MDNFEIIDFNKLDTRKRKTILRQAVDDKDKVALQRMREGLNPRGFELQFNNIVQIEKLNHG